MGNSGGTMKGRSGIPAVDLVQDIADVVEEQRREAELRAAKEQLAKDHARAAVGLPPEGRPDTRGNGLPLATRALTDRLLQEGLPADGGRDVNEALESEPADAVLWQLPKAKTGNHFADTYPDWRPIILAPIAKGDSDTVGVILSRGCEKSLKKVWTFHGGKPDPLEYTVSTAAAFAGNRLVWERVLSAGAAVQEDRLAFAAYTGSIEIMASAVENLHSQPALAPLQRLEALEPSGSSLSGMIFCGIIPPARPRNAWMVAAGRGHLSCLKAMLRLGGARDCISGGGGKAETALHAAAEGPLGWHVEQGVTVDSSAPNADALPYAKMRKCLNLPRQPLPPSAAYRAIIRTLVAAGADLEAKGKGGFTPLLRACEYAHYPAIIELLLQGANAHAKTSSAEDVFELLDMGKREWAAHAAFLPPPAPASAPAAPAGAGASHHEEDGVFDEAAARARVQADEVAYRLLQLAEARCPQH